MGSVRDRPIHVVKGRTSGSRGASFLGGTAISPNGSVQHELESTTHSNRSGALLVRNVISPAALAANTDDWAPDDLADADVIRASTDASRNLTGIVAPESGFQALLLYNVGTFDLVLQHDATSTAANRFYCPGSADLTLRPDAAVLLIYDLTSSRWRVIVQTVISVLQELYLAGVISPAQLTADTDDWAPDGFANATLVRASTDASRQVSGIAGGSAGRAIVLMNVGAFDLVLLHDVTSTAANRFLCPNDTSMTLQKNSVAILVYDGTSSRWRVVGGGGGGGAVAAAPTQIGQVIDGGSATITTGIKQVMLPVPYDCTVVAARVYADQSGSIQIDVLRTTHADYEPGTHPVAGDSIIGAGTDIIVTTTFKYEDTTLDWDDVTLQQGDILALNVISATTIRKVTVSLEIEPL